MTEAAVRSQEVESFLAPSPARPPHATVNAVRLRTGVELSEETDRSVLRDTSTGLRLELGKDAGNLLRAAFRGTPGAVQGDAAASFLAQLAALGLFEPSLHSEAAVAQGEYVLRQARDAELARVRNTVERAARSTRLHREHLGPTLAANPEWQLEDLPLLRKPSIRRHFPAGLITEGLDLGALLRSRDLVVAATSGSTGERLQVYSDTRIPRLPPDFLSFWRLHGLPKDRPVRTAIFTSPNCSGTTCSSQLAFAERISFEHTLFLPSPRNPFRMTDQEVCRIVEEMHEFAADFWLVNPVYLAALADRAEACGCTFPPVAAILYSYQYFSHCQRRALARHFDAPVFAFYSATELAGSQIGVGCPEGNLHVRLDQVFVELLQDGKPVAGSKLGSVTVTSHNETLPLVRYALGDLARMQVAPCACDVGSAWPSLVLEGRQRDAFLIGDRVVTTKQVDDALQDVPLVMYQLAELAPGVYRLSAIPEHTASHWREAAEQAISKLLAPRELVLEEVRELPLDDSQKFRFTLPLPRAEAAEFRNQC